MVGWEGTDAHCPRLKPGCHTGEGGYMQNHTHDQESPNSEANATIAVAAPVLLPSLADYQDRCDPETPAKGDENETNDAKTDYGHQPSFVFLCGIRVAESGRSIPCPGRRRHLRLHRLLVRIWALRSVMVWLKLRCGGYGRRTWLHRPITEQTWHFAGCNHLPRVKVAKLRVFVQPVFNDPFLEILERRRAVLFPISTLNHESHLTRLYNFRITNVKRLPWFVTQISSASSTTLESNLKPIVWPDSGRALNLRQM